MQQKEKTMNNYNYYVKIFYIKNNVTKRKKTFTFDNHKEYDKFFDYILNLRYNKESNIYDLSYGYAVKVDTTEEAINKLLKRGDVLLPGADENIDISDMLFEEA